MIYPCHSLNILWETFQFLQNLIIWQGRNVNDMTSCVELIVKFVKVNYNKLNSIGEIDWIFLLGWGTKLFAAGCSTPTGREFWGRKLCEEFGFKFVIWKMNCKKIFIFVSYNTHSRRRLNDMWGCEVLVLYFPINISVKKQTFTKWFYQLSTFNLSKDIENPIPHLHVQRLPIESFGF